MHTLSREENAEEKEERQGGESSKGKELIFEPSSSTEMPQVTIIISYIPCRSW